MPELPPPPTYSAATNPWIDARTGPSYRRVGLQDLLLNAHTLDDLALAAPPAASALLRIAVAIAARITGLDDPDLTAQQWTELRREVLHTGRLDPADVHTYFTRHCWDVFDPHRPWLQDAALREQCPPDGINALVHRPAGNNLVWFTAPGDTPAPVPTPHALQHLLIWHFYGRHGTGRVRTVGSRSSKQLYSGPLRTTVSYHPQGRTLFETLVAGCPPFTGEEQLEADLCPWEAPPPDPLAPPHPITWPGRLLTGRSRHALLLVPDPTGSAVTDAHISWALPSSDAFLEASDPYLAHTTPSGQHDRAGVPRRGRRRADADRAWWRELDTLLLAPDEDRAMRRPDIFSTLNDLPEDLRQTLRVRVHGFHQDPVLTINRQWYTALTPPLLHWMQEHDPARAQRIADCCQSAEEVAETLDHAARQAWKDIRRAAPRRNAGAAWAADATARYWPGAEKAFWRLLDTPDEPVRPAFTRAAAGALRAATQSDRARSPHAARAVARAVRSLHTPHHTQRKRRT
ncbi:MULTISPECIES: type I-E CRISPR-associated protein Cse1/CasA [unclassified Streptomyces]|uniref:type I-E CRISPR-associated protein Cse1/CasA n=1 Tax=unclassified Streptomyces TaxID=2593676 RepID=UPI002258D9AE|nr:MULTISPECIES: type I-E CRISPR-associated protein Cse1/CasA [unclassified Streptomyces]MCX4650288.1 type I-E CRISPR-associated protein Cse1/CasA [Streptomyces sp. NBC_01446]MCX5321591.1 type I-E CRISPR-associated protein Cse1/CasA [Streptomyces sp. NBC_00120]MCX5323865.1 type I-E CRISPR-associated protein Cse1/CasA [Streptomyces sp. NBC_00120]MCX5327715.1 type I-E CRISPR-associated protein Cse1/CasA [Streptomyces sp. NBC_00120]